MSVKKCQDHRNDHFAVHVPKLEIMERHTLTGPPEFFDQAEKVAVRKEEIAGYEKKPFGSED
ncbi:MAG: hypothetical protein LBF25_01850 [Puniceicoccales bacterium]|nr:hypothetical protein [Puniceicoccales bacterium]